MTIFLYLFIMKSYLFLFNDPCDEQKLNAK